MPNFHAFTLLGGKLYGGIGELDQDGMFVSYDLKTSKIQVLASSRRKQKQSPLDDTAPFSIIISIWPDPPRDRVVFYAASSKWDARPRRVV